MPKLILRVFRNCNWNNLHLEVDTPLLLALCIIATLVHTSVIEDTPIKLTLPDLVKAAVEPIMAYPKTQIHMFKAQEEGTFKLGKGRFCYKANLVASRSLSRPSICSEVIVGVRFPPSPGSYRMLTQVSQRARFSWEKIYTVLLVFYCCPSKLPQTVGKGGGRLLSYPSRS